MRLVIILLTAGILQVSAASYAQKITIQTKNETLEKFLKTVRQQTGYDIVCDQQILKDAAKVTINLKDATVEQALSATLEPQHLSYTLSDKLIVIEKKAPSLIQKIKEAIAAIDVTGRVTDENNQPLAGATITEKGTNNSTTTDANGFFTLKQTQHNATIVFSFIGYDKREMLAAPNFGQVKLTVATSKLDEVKVIAYGQTTDRLSVGNVSTIKAADIEKQSVSNPLLALQGRVPGLMITQVNGLSGSTVNIQLQGQNSIANGNDPLFVIDGIPYNAQNFTSYGQVPNPLGGGLSGPSVLSFINPLDIESISVLKDADATAIYGSRAANGAILITTKKGKQGRLSTDVDLQEGASVVPKKLDLLNSQQYIAMRREGLKNDGFDPNPSIVTTPSNTAYDINGLWDPNAYTDWQKQLLGNTAQYNNFHATVSSGNELVQFLVGANYYRETTVFPGEYSDRKADIHFNVNTASINQKFKLQLTTSYLADDNKLPRTDLTSLALTTPPNAPNLYNSDGSVNWAPNPAGNSSWQNPIAAFKYNSFESQTKNLISNLTLNYQIIKGLTLRSSFGYNLLTTDMLGLFPILSTKPESRTPNSRTDYVSNNKSTTWIVEPQIHYQASLWKGNLEALVGSTIQQNTGNSLTLRGTGFNSDAVLADILSASVVNVLGTTDYTYKYNALFGRANYTLSEKYILSLSARRDGSSRFGSANAFHNFWSVGAAWIFQQEKLLRDRLAFLSFGKLRFSYGTTGSDRIGDYQYLSLYSAYPVGVPYQGVAGIQPTGLPNPNLQWEETRKAQIGIDLGFFKDNLLLNLTYSRNRTSNQLIGYNLPVITGSGYVNENLPALVENSSTEFSASGNIVKNVNFKWTANFNLSAVRNKLVSYPGLTDASFYVIGQPLGILQLYHYAGVDPTTGVYTFYDQKGSITSTPNPTTDKTVMKDIAFPTLFGGIGNTLTYKQFQLDFFFQFVKRPGSNLNFGLGLAPGYLFNNQTVDVLNRWQKPGDAAQIQRFSSNTGLFSYNGNVMNSDARYSDDSYLRLKTASLSYSLPATLNHALHLNNARLYIQGQNLLTFTKYNGLDPETLSLTAVPLLRTVVVGLKVTL